MRNRWTRQDRSETQETLPFPGWGRRRADNDDDPFSWPHLPVRRELTGFEVDSGTQFNSKIAVRGLTLSDAIARSGPLQGNACREGRER